MDAQVEITATRPIAWEYERRGDTVRAFAASAGVFALGFAALATVFNPVALGVTGAMGAGAAVSMIISNNFKAIRERQIQKSIRAQHYSRDPQFIKGQFVSLNSIKPLLDETRKRFGIPHELDAVFLNTRDSAMAERMFAIATHQNFFMTTPQALIAFPHDYQRRFIIAHECAHEKTEDITQISHLIGYGALSARRKMLRMVVPVVSISLAAKLLGNEFLMNARNVVLQPNAYALVAIGLLFGATQMVKISAAYVSRLAEYRADRNALYVTGDLDGALNALKDIYDGNKGRGLRRRYLKQVDSYFNSHPTLSRRMLALHKEWPRVVAAYEQEGRSHEIVVPRQLSSRKARLRPSIS